MNKTRIWGAVIAIALTLGASSAFAQKKHESNTLKKVGQKIGHGTTKAYKATEYGVRKGAESVSVDAHRATGKDSVKRNRGKSKDELITPEGKHVKVPKNYTKPVKRDLKGRPKA